VLGHLLERLADREVYTLGELAAWLAEKDAESAAARTGMTAVTARRLARTPRGLARPRRLARVLARPRRWLARVPRLARLARPRRWLARVPRLPWRRGEG